MKPMSRFPAFFLSQYDPGDKELYLKAKFVLIITLIVALSLVSTMAYAYFMLGFSRTVIFTELAGFAVMLWALVLLIKGRYALAVHVLLTAGFGTIWMVMFVSPNTRPLTMLDSIVFVPALMSAMPLMFLKRRRPMVLYFAANMAVFWIFNVYLLTVEDLTTTERLDYLFDNSIAMIFVFFVSFILFSIYQQALTSLKKELEERKKAEKALQESENRLSVHLQNTPVGAISWDMDFRVMEWNPAAESIFGYRKQEAVGERISALIFSPEQVHPFEKDYRALLSGRGGDRSIRKNRTRTGKSILCDWYNTVLKDTRGEITGVAALVNDITEIKKTQEMIIQSEKMVSVGGLAAGMAHEINNPLAGMIQNAQVIHNRLTKDLPANETAARELDLSMPAIRRYMESRGILNHLDSITQAGMRAAKIIENMLSFAKKSDASGKKVDLTLLADKTLDLVKNDFGLNKTHDAKHMDIVREYSPDLPPVFCEESKIQQVLFNLFKNAAESMGGGTTEGERPRLTIRLKQEDRMVCIEVEDNGPGMDEETRKRIFEPFFTTKGPEKGTGLGLSVSYFIVVDNHGGQMTVDSSPGKGARFTVRLPLRSEIPL
nr:PAS domain S-box protein [Desulfobacula sp.]